MATTADMREHVRRAVGRPARSAEPAPGFVVQGPCQECGKQVRYEVPDGAAAVVRMLARNIGRSRTLMCAACGEQREREEREREARERLERVVASRRGSAGVPRAWAEQSFDGLERDELRARAIMRAEQWARGEVDGVLLWGEPGRGKTAIAAAAANARMRVGPVRWLSVPDLMMGLRMPFDSAEYREAVRRLRAPRDEVAIVLDDLDKARATEHGIEPLFGALNGWMEAGMPLLVTANRDLGALAQWLPETFAMPLVSRLSGYCRIQHVDGRDRRVEP